MVYPTVPTRPRRLALDAIAPAAALLLLLAGGAGCSTNPESAVEAFPSVPVPLPPVFMTGAMPLLLTNNSPYAAQVTVTERIGGQDETVTGDLLVQGTRILFAAHPKQEGEHRYAKEGGFSFLWMADRNQGFVLSEAMQGYAPVSLGAVPTNFISAPGGAGEFLEGHPCRVETAIAHLNNGQIAAFKTWRATDLKDVPLRITALSNAPTVTVTLSKVRAQTVPQEAMAPPSGFTRYTSAEALADEMAMRQRNLKRKSWESY